MLVMSKILKYCNMRFPDTARERVFAYRDMCTNIVQKLYSNKPLSCVLAWVGGPVDIHIIIIQTTTGTTHIKD